MTVVVRLLVTETFAQHTVIVTFWVHRANFFAFEHKTLTKGTSTKSTDFSLLCMDGAPPSTNCPRHPLTGARVVIICLAQQPHWQPRQRRKYLLLLYVFLCSLHHCLSESCHQFLPASPCLGQTCLDLCDGDQLRLPEAAQGFWQVCKAVCGRADDGTS